jgi:zinc transport system ATP-binding protein
VLGKLLFLVACSDYLGITEVCFGQDIRKNNSILRSIGYIPQQKSIEQAFPATVEEIISLGMIGKKIFQKRE